MDPFPSGHTTEAFAYAEFIQQEYKDVSPWYGAVGYAAATATGLLRIYNNKHWLSDVVAGAGIGMASTKLAYLLYRAIKRKSFKIKKMNTMINITIVLTAVAIFELTPATPIFEKMAVSDANKAESSAYIHHMVFMLLVINKVNLSQRG